MTDYRYIYSREAEKYERLIGREDHKENIKPALVGIRPLAGLEVIELGAGTGRITRLLAPEVAHIMAFDGSMHMLSVAQRELSKSGLSNWRLAAADNRFLPVKSGSADLAIAGWSLGHSVGWYPESWRQEIGLVLVEMTRALRPGGTIILLETLGTNRATPRPPTAGLAVFFSWLEQEHGFRRTWIRTDYRFASVQEANELTRFFFGDEMANDILARGSAIVPECTGIWWRTTDQASG
ncbi:MAG: class I SAM-dependent methyltransferase [Chloroflexota bacterium]